MITPIKIFLFVFIVCFHLIFVHCAKILAVFPMPSISHQIVFRPLTQELARRGHKVTVITTDPAFPKNKAPLNLTEIDVHDVSYKIWSRALEEHIGSKSDIFSQIQVMMGLISKVFEAQLNITEVKNIIRKKKNHFDLLLIEACVRPALILTHIFKIPVIQISSFGGLRFNYDVVGAATHPILYPMVLQQKIYNLTSYDKLELLYNVWRMEAIYQAIEHKENQFLRNTFGQNTPSLRELSDNVHMLFLNNHQIWTHNQPVPSNVIYIGGIYKNPTEKLSKDLHSLLNESKNGVIYFSLGTNVNTSMLPLNKVQIMVKVFSQLPYDVIWKWDLDTLPGITDNIKIYKWLPQADLLRHPKVKLFITQGGLQSTDEAIGAGVPLIGIPMIADQWYNTEKYEYHKIGIKLDLPSLTEELFKEAIEKVMFDSSYRENINRIRTIIEDQPKPPLERAVWWTEYVIRHGGAKHLRAAGANISWSQYLELDLIAIVFVVSLSSLVLLSLALYIVMRNILQYIGHNIKILKI